MKHSQLFTDLAHIAYAGYVPKTKLDRIAGKASWDDFGHTEQEIGKETPPSNAEGNEDNSNEH